MMTNECTYIARGLGRKVRGQVERAAMVRHLEGYRARAARDDLDVVAVVVLIGQISQG
jgi:hypothetical protein